MLHAACYATNTRTVKKNAQIVEAMKPLLPGTLDSLKAVTTATLHTQLFKRGLRNTFMYGLRPLNPEAASFAGEAFTLRYVPAREDLDALEAFDDPEHPQRLAIEQVPSGQVLVMDCRQDPRAASGGEILMARLRVRGVAAMVTDASMRDSPSLATSALPIFAAGASAALNLVLHHAADMQVPIGCAGVPVYPGDVVVGDGEGVIVVPRHLADEVAVAAVQQDALEKFLLRKVMAGAPLKGTYPPNLELLAEYETTRGPVPAVGHT